MASTIFAFQYDAPVDDVYAAFVDTVLAQDWFFLYDVQNQVELSAKSYPFTVAFFEKQEVVDPEADALNKAFGTHYTYDPDTHADRLTALENGTVYPPPD